MEVDQPKRKNKHHSIFTKMKPNDINFESSANSKSPFWGTRARILSLGGFTYLGLTDAAHAERDVALLALAFMLEAVSFAVLGHKFNFAGSLIIGLWVFDIAGALLWHAGSADSRLRDAKIKTAASHEDEEAIREQRPQRYAWLNALGAILIAGPCVFKCLLLLSNLLVFKVMGLGGPALLVAYIGIAVIHFGFTGHALAYLRAMRAEKKELSSMLKSGGTDEERKRHPNRIKAHRKHYFISQMKLMEVDNIGGHSLKHEMSYAGPGFRYVLTTWGRLFDNQVAEMAARQTNPEQKSKLGREGLIHQLDIEQSAPLAAAEIETADTHAAVQVAASHPHPELTTAPRSGSVPMNGLRQAGVALLMLGCILGMSSCNQPETKKVNVVIVADHALAAGEKTPMPENLVNLIAPEVPLMERFVIEPSAVRLDLLNGSEATNLLPPADANALFGAIQDMSQLNSPELEAADRRQRLARAQATVLGTKKGVATSSSVALWQQWAQANHEAGYKVIALRQKARPSGTEPLDLTGIGKVSEVSKPEEVHVLMAALLKNEPESSFAVLIDPPVTQPLQVVKDPLSIPAPTEEAAPESSGVQETQSSREVGHTKKDKLEGATASTKATVGITSSSPSHNVTVSGPFIFMPEKSGELPKVTDADGRVHAIKKQELAGSVPFEKTSSRITPKTEQALVEIETKCKSDGIIGVILEGSADPKGGKDMVEDLSQRRCNTVRSWLLERGIPTLECIPLGADRVPTSTSVDDYERHRNVRVYIMRPAEQSSSKAPAVDLPQVDKN